MLKSKKANIAVGILVIIIIIIIVVWLVNISGRECTQDSQCGSESYCGSDFKCHKIPIIEKTITQNQYGRAATILGFAMIIAAVILKWNGTSVIRKLKRNKTPNTKPEKKKNTQYPHRPIIFKQGHYARDNEPYMVGEYK